MIEKKRASQRSNITQKWVSTIMPFSNKYYSKMTASEISRQVKIPQQSVSRILNDLVRKNLFEYERQGKNKLFYLNIKKIQTEIVLELVETQKALEYLIKYKKIEAIIEDLLKDCESIILFGSYASGKFDEKSDIDLVVFGAKKEFLQKIKKFPIEINSHFTTYNEFKKLINGKNPLTTEILENHIIFGNTSKIVKIFIKNG